VSIGRTRYAIALAGATALLLTACGGGDSADSEGATEGTAASGEIITDIGVTDTPCPEAVNPDNGCIYLGILSDLTEGPFAALATQVVAGQEAFWATVNAEGGISGYDVNVTEYTRDNKYDPAVQSQEYRSIEPNVLALAQTLGTAQTQAILADMDADNVVGVPASWWSGWQHTDDDNGLILESGASYCVMAMSGLDWWQENKGAPTKIVAVGPPGDFGGDYAAGVQAWAEANDVEYGGFIEALPNALAGNQDATVQQILSSGADVVGIAIGPVEVAEIVGKSAAQGYTGQFVGAAPTWNPLLLQTAAAPALTAQYTNIGTSQSFGADTAAHAQMQAALGEGQTPTNDGFTYGWVWQYPMLSLLEQAAANGDLTREGLRAVAEDGFEVDYNGALPNVTVNGSPDDVDRSVTVSVPDAASPLGIRTVEVEYTGPTAEAFDYSATCAG
jgi:ABC-type branched-subunit amino acid transport system substrate-binding protein